MRIYIEKYSWDISTDINEVNFFSDAVQTLEDTLEIHNDLTGVSWIEKNSFGDINYNFSNIDEDNSLYFTASNLQFRIFNDASINLDSFFEVYNTGAFVRFKLFVFNGDEKIYTGVINRNDVNYSSKKREILDVICIGYEKEFKEYYSNIKIIDSAGIPAFGDDGLNLTGIRLMRIQNVLFFNFSLFLFDVSPTGFFMQQRIYMTDRPYIFSAVSEMSENDLFECKGGYINFYNAGYTKFQFFNFLMLSLGWVWFFYLDKLVILPAYDVQSDELVLNYNNTFIEHSVGSSQLDFSKDNIVIETGEYYSKNAESGPQSPLRVQRTVQNADSTYIGGERNIVYSLKNSPTQEIRPYKKLIFGASGSSLVYRIDYAVNVKRYNNSDRYNHNYLQDYITVNPNNSSLYDITQTPYQYSVNNSVVINTGVTGRNNGAYLDVNNARGSTGRYYGGGNSLSTTNEITNSEIGYTGSVGESLVYKDLTNNKFYTYENYMKRDEVKRNFITYVSNSINILMGLTVYQLITNPLQCVSLINYPFADINGIPMAITDLSYNIFTLITNLNVQFENE